MNLAVREKQPIVGRVSFTVHNADGSVAAIRKTRNLMCTAGVNQLAAAVTWSAAQDQNANMGNPLNPTFLTPVWGAVGSSSTAAVVTDTQLGAELGRTTIANASSGGPIVLLTFFFPTSASGWAVTECGVFCAATSAANNGLLLNHAVFGSVNKSTSQTATLQITFTF